MMRKKVGETHMTLTVLALLAMATFSFGAPLIEVDDADYDFGAIEEGTIKILKHEFKIKNTGDEPLKIEKVRPG